MCALSALKLKKLQVSEAVGQDQLHHRGIRAFCRASCRAALPLPSRTLALRRASSPATVPDRVRPAEAEPQVSGLCSPTRVPKLREAVRDAKKAGHVYVALDGPLAGQGLSGAPRPRKAPQGKNKPESRRSNKAFVNCAYPASADVRLRSGASSARSAAAPGAPVGSPRPSTYCRPAR